MTYQTIIVLCLAALSAAFLLRGLFQGSSGKTCASGCGTCRSKACALRQMEAPFKVEAKTTR